MNKKILFAIQLLALCLIPSLTVVGSVGSYGTPYWTMCTGSHVHGNIEIGGSIGQNTVVVSWIVPPTDWENDFGKCYPIPLSQTSMTVYVNDPSFRPVPTTVVCHSFSCSDGFSLLVIKEYCVNHTCIGETKSYNLRYGDSITAELDIEYASGVQYFGSYTLAITS